MATKEIQKEEAIEKRLALNKLLLFQINDQVISQLVLDPEHIIKKLELPIRVNGPSGDMQKLGKPKLDSLNFHILHPSTLIRPGHQQV